jgi:hypothetical protein
MADDFLLDNAEKRLRTLRASKQRAMANLAEYQASECDDAAQEELGTLAYLEVEERGILQMRADYLRAQNPAPTAPQSDQEWLSKSVERMDYNDVARIAAKSKYGFDDAAFRAGIAEVQRRRARGE